MSEKWMQQALDLARNGEGRTSPNPPVGAVVVSGGGLVGQGYHPAAGSPHAEVFALREAGERARGADLYVTLEPCNHQGRTGPCTEAIIAAGIGRVRVGCIDPNPRVAGAGIARLRAAGIEVESGLLEAECRRLVAPFAKQIATGLPFVTLKSAMTLDGQMATHTGDSRWISSEQSRLQVHRMRNRVDAILTGVGSIVADDSLLTTRLPEGGRDALRVVVDSRLRIPDMARIIVEPAMAPPLIVATPSAPTARVEALRDRGVEVEQVEADADGRVALPALLQLLGRRQVQHLLLEAGGILNGAALRAGLVDRVAFFVAPKLIGGDDGRHVFQGAGAALLKDAVQLHDIRWRQIGDDLLLEAEVMPCLPD